MLNKLQGSGVMKVSPYSNVPQPVSLSLYLLQWVVARLWIYWINQIHLSPNNDTGLPLNVPPL